MSYFEREDWTLFRNLQTIGQKAGVPPETIPRLVAKELVDNALDVAGACKFGLLGNGRFYVQDAGPGLPGTGEEVAALFSVARPLTSSKLLRLPTRGALGNGLRVVTGAVLASGGELVVKTGGRALRLVPRDEDGGNDVTRLGDWRGPGTRVEVKLGPALVVDEDVFAWAKRAVSLSTTEIPYVDDAGLFTDFHALRHSYISLLTAGGVHPKIAQRLARHSDINLTMSRYSHTLLKDEAEGLKALPQFPSVFDGAPRTEQTVLRATGTDAADAAPNDVKPARETVLPLCLPETEPHDRATVHFGAVSGPGKPDVSACGSAVEKTPKIPEKPAKKASEDASVKEEIESTPDRIRTCNPRFRRPSRLRSCFHHASKSAVLQGFSDSPCFDNASLNRRFRAFVGGLVGGQPT